MTQQTIKDISAIVKLSLKILIGILLIGLILLPQFGDYQLELAKTSGILAVVFFGLSQVPGIIRRLQVQGLAKELYRILLPSRAQIGIVMFLFALFHYLGVYFFPVILPLTEAGVFPELTGYSLTGILSLYSAFFLFLTSNTQSKKILKRYWTYLHRLVFIMVWTIALHILFVTQYQYNLYGEISFGSLISFGIIMITGIAQVISLIVFMRQKSHSQDS